MTGDPTPADTDATSTALSIGELLKHGSLGLVVFPLLTIAATAVHELVHLAINYAATGAIRACGPLGPLTVVTGRPAVCLAPGGVPGWNALLTPVATAVLGFAFMAGSSRFQTRGVRWGVFVAGAWVWLRESLYGAGWLMPPTLSGDGVRYWGDGREALEAFGWTAQLPAALLLAAGVLVLHARLKYTR